MGADSQDKELEKLFKKLKESLDESDKKDILYQISCLLDKIYKLFRNKNNKDGTKDDRIESNLSDETGTGNLHSHILAFMRWLPIIPAGQQQDQMIMESVDNVIERIEKKIHETIEKDDNLKDLLTKFPTDCHKTIFIQANCKDMRKLLIDAMYYEPYIRSQFLRYYDIEVFKKEAEGGI